MEPPTLETGSNSFYRPLHSYHRILFYVQFFIVFKFDFILCSSPPVIISICSSHLSAAPGDPVRKSQYQFGRAAGTSRRDVCTQSRFQTSTFSPITTQRRTRFGSVFDECLVPEQVGKDWETQFVLGTGLYIRRAVGLTSCVATSDKSCR